MKPTIQQELPLWPDEEDVEQAVETLQLYMIEQSLAAKSPTKDDLLSQLSILVLQKSLFNCLVQSTLPNKLIASQVYL